MSTRACTIMALPWRDPLVAFAPLCNEPYALLLGPGGEDTGKGRWSIVLARPTEIFEASGPDALDTLPPLQSLSSPIPLPFVGGYAGLASYELGAGFDQVPHLTGSAWPDLAFGHYTCAALFDHHKKSLWVVGPDRKKAEHFASFLGDEPLGTVGRPNPAHVHFQLEREQCIRQIERVIALIHAGDIFQANISQGFHIDLDTTSDAFTFYRRLCDESPAPFGAYFKRNTEQTLLSNSPEQFFVLGENGTVQTLPIKGTRPRSKDRTEDRAQSEILLHSAKDRSENLMIVDLMRNDFSRVCTPGTVHVPEHCALQSFANVHHLVSTVEGQLQSGKTALDVLRACFPAGSITGAPKIRAMEIIAQMEHQARGPYYGSLGYISANGNAMFNVLIRTGEYTIKDGRHRLDFRTGGGIVADSDAAMEYLEMLDKARALCLAAGAEI